MTPFATLLPLVLLALDAPADPAPAPAPAPEAEVVPFEAPKFGVKVSLPKEWPIAVREEEDRVFVAMIKQKDPDRPGVIACELGLAPENLDEYRTRIEGNAKRGNRRGGTLTKNEVVKGPKGERLETSWEFRPPTGVLWHELIVRLIANRQMYTFTLNVDDDSYPVARTRFDALIASAEFSAPNTGADLLTKANNRWVQREFKFALDLPQDWQPVLAPSEVALLFANAPATGIWSDNVLVLANPHRELDLKGLAESLPDQLRKVEPNCEVLVCEVVKQGKTEALETVVRTQRGPFSMTILERRFRGERFDYEVKYTIESKRFDELAPALRKSLDGFEELPGTVPGAAGKAA
ncbi:hypothetical protein [Singulisphaera sp. PoT]|uniref:hypothetical protein n=1 Tax=Singulisphaera sp. PoT TaxID=3411797 RepID=UPI003BF48F53